MPCSVSPVSAVRRSCARRTRAASARASAAATSSSESVGPTEPESIPERDRGPSGSVTSAGSSQRPASGPSGSCTGKQLITRAWVQCRHRAAAAWLLHAEMFDCQGGGEVAFGVLVRRAISPQESVVGQGESE